MVTFYPEKKDSNCFCFCFCSWYDFDGNCLSKKNRDGNCFCSSYEL